ncbi:Imm50 family immunity protein [Achromobacter sp. NPDC058515]|uniref:Imm50 family immunity protein n=1 Tax=Achromobacter sp. NPDC058515 TaxID=3346533 RepID=UPI003647B121
MFLNKECLGRSEFLFSLYGDALSFEEIDVQEIKFGWDGPIVRLLISLKDFPLSPPAKWRGLNVVQVELSIFPLHEVNLSSFGRGNKCNLTIEGCPGGDTLIVQLTGESTASFKTTTVTVDKVSAYLRE